MTPQVSIIIPCYNRANLIGATLESVIGQTYQNWECIVVDDYSTDQSRETIQAYCAKDTRVKYLLNHRKKGAQGARNTGILESKGKYIQFFDSDDVMLPQLIEALYAHIFQSNADIVTCFSYVVDENGKEIGKFEWVNKGNILEGLLNGNNYVDYNCALIKKELLLKIGLTDEYCPSFQEWDTHIRLSEFAQYSTVHRLLIKYYRRTSGTISSDDKRTVEGYLYILNKHRNKFLTNIDVFQKQGLTALSLAEKTNDIKYIKKVKSKLTKLIPRFRKLLNKDQPSMYRKVINLAEQLYHKVFTTISVAEPAKPKRKSGNYISCEETVNEANKRGLSVGEYVEEIWNQQGQSEEVILELHSYGFFQTGSTMLEIGGGTGRYIDHVLKKYPVKNIISYEIAEDWSYYLEEKYAPILVRRDSDGFNLKFEKDSSIDNLVAHGVFVYLPLLHAFHYFREIARVTKNKGLVAFDIYTAEQFDIPMIDNWLDKGGHYYPVIISQQLVVDYFSKLCFTYLGSFNNKHGYSFSTYLVFQKND
ncbi:glycosyltransferase [Thermoflexibacter ruber]|uniref:Methyltransferase domain-containing protein n=1 Tax=Thermoflexibacter ruber TaxID=1003 RepID=A0A1I2GMR0_9BACT|nr:glycosyltransferase [Thermoflexibacter ruber]SFF18299.1 Methyltransferase domain-containing protein [Thermoflexibacter ruber]